MALGLKITVMSRLAEGQYQGFSNNSTVVLHVKLGEYGVLAKILCKNVQFLYKIQMPQIIRDELLRDCRTIKTILEKSEKEVLK